MSILDSLFAGLEPSVIYLAVIGQVLHIAARLLKLVKSKQKFVLKVWVIENILETIIAGLMISVLLVVFKEQMNEITAVTIGYSTDSLFKQMLTKGGSTDPTPLNKPENTGG